MAHNMWSHCKQALKTAMLMLSTKEKSAYELSADILNSPVFIVLVTFAFSSCPLQCAYGEVNN